MIKQLKTLDQLTDSRLMFEKDLPPFGYMIAIVITAFLIGVTVWSTHTPKIYMITAEGIMTSNNSNYVMPVYTGEISKSNMKEGMLVEKGDMLFTMKSTEYDLQEEQLLANRADYEEKKGQYQKLVHSIKDNTNYFDAANPADNLYYSTYETYQSQVEQNQLDTSTYKTYGYTEEQIEAEIEKNQGKITEVYYCAIESAENSIQECETQIQNIDAQMGAVGSGQTAYETRASVSGTLHLLGDYKTGMVVQTGNAVASITPENEETIIEVQVSPSDMARVKENDSVQIAVSGLTQSVYGTISGRVMQIDSNATAVETKNGTQNRFKIRIKPEQDYLVSRSGDKVKITNGMAVEARIQYDKVSYLNYLLQKLGFKEN